MKNRLNVYFDIENVYGLEKGKIMRLHFCIQEKGNDMKFKKYEIIYNNIDNNNKELSEMTYECPKLILDNCILKKEIRHKNLLIESLRLELYQMRSRTMWQRIFNI